MVNVDSQEKWSRKTLFQITPLLKDDKLTVSVSFLLKFFFSFVDDLNPLSSNRTSRNKEKGE